MHLKQALMGMYKIFILVLLLTSSSSLCFGQKHFEKGYIIENDGRQVNGFIDLRSNSQNSKICVFFSDLKKTPENFTPDDIRSYKTDTKYYVSKEVTIDSVKRKFFLEYLVDGIADLYYLRDALNEYYFIEKNGELTELQNNQTKITIEGDQTYIKKSNQYIGALNYMFSDGNGFSQKIDRTPFSYRSLINLTKDYHKAVCSEYECIDYTHSSTQKFVLEIGTGLYYSGMTLKTSSDIQHNIRPGIMVNLRFIPLKSNTHWSLLLGLNYSVNNFQGLYDAYLFSNSNTYKLTEKYSIFRMPIIAQYEIGSKRFQPVIYLGYTACMYGGAESSATMDFYYGEAPVKSAFRKYHHGLNSGVGIKFNQQNSSYFFLKANYEYRIPSVNFRNIFDYVKHHSVLVNIGYAFKI